MIRQEVKEVTDKRTSNFRGKYIMSFEVDKEIYDLLSLEKNKSLFIRTAIKSYVEQRK